MLQQTLSIIKPDATRRNLIGKILAHLEENELTVKALKRLHLTREQAEGFYAEHKRFLRATGRIYDFSTDCGFGVGG